MVFDEQTSAWLIPGFANRQSRPDDAQQAHWSKPMEQVHWREQKRKQRKWKAVRVLGLDGAYVRGWGEISRRC